MTLTVSEGKKLGEVQELFTSRYPFLKLEVYRAPDKEGQLKKNISHETVLKYSPGHSGGFSVEDSMTVSELTRLFLEYFGLRAIVFRKAGTIWLETTFTSNWTLHKQNDHGKEISEPEHKHTGDA